MQNSEVLGLCVDYDIVFVGHLGTVVANLFCKTTDKTFKGLIITSNKHMKDPSLLPNSDPIVKIDRTFPEELDVDTGQIFRLIPEDNLIAMENKVAYHYRFLIYTAEAQHWADYSMINNLKEALNTNYSFVFSNIKKWSAEQEITQTKLYLREKERRVKKIQGQKKQEKTEKRMRSAHSSLKVEFAEIQNRDTFSSLIENTVNLVFYVPKPPHRGYDNYNILYKLHEIKNKWKNISKKSSSKLSCLSWLFEKFNRKSGDFAESSQKNEDSEQGRDEQQDQIVCILIMEGGMLFPQNQKIDKIAQQYLRKNGVILIKNTKVVKINYLRRILKVVTKDNHPIIENLNLEVILEGAIDGDNGIISAVPYDYFYAIIKEKAPQILKAAEINPYDNCPYTLWNNHYRNICIFGADIFPTIHSFSAINFQAHIICRNLQINNNSTSFATSSSKKKLEYNGYSEIPFWIDSKNVVKFKSKYSAAVGKEDIINCIFGMKKESESTRGKLKSKYSLGGGPTMVSKIQSKDLYANQSNLMNSEEHNAHVNHMNMRGDKSPDQFIKSQMKQKDHDDDLALQKSCCGLAEYIKQTLIIPSEASFFYNLKSYGMPYYFFSPELEQSSSFTQQS